MSILPSIKSPIASLLKGSIGSGGAVFVPEPLWDYEPNDPSTFTSSTLPPPPFLIRDIFNLTSASVKVSDMEQSTESNRPQLVSSIFGAVSGMHTINDSTNFMESLSNGGIPFPPEMTIFVRFKFTAENTSFPTNILFMHFADWVTASGVDFAISVNDVTTELVSNFFETGLGVFDTLVSSPALTPGSVNLVVMRYSKINNVHDIRINGVLKASGTASANPLSTPEISQFNWGGRSGLAFSGDLDYGNLRGYRAFLNQAQINQISNEINGNL